MNVIKKIFIKNYQNTSDKEVRLCYGLTAGIFGIIINILLCASKLVVGILSGSVAIIADAINNLSDFSSSLLTIFGFKYSNLPPDEKHPFGHQRFEYISALIIAISVVVIGILLFKGSIENIIYKTGVKVEYYTYIVLSFSIVLKGFLGLIFYDFGKSIKSQSLKASAIDSRNDVLTTTAVLISTIVIQQTGINIDGYVGVLISLIIIISSFKLLKDTINSLIGYVPDKKYVKKIVDKINSYDVVMGVHDLTIHSYGPQTTFATIHVEVDASKDIIIMHDAIDNIERDFLKDLNIHLVIHMDPVVKNDKETDALKNEITTILKELDSSITLHDFRIVKGHTHINVLFDCILPYKSNITKNQIIDLLNQKIKSEIPYYYIITIDNTAVL